MRKHFSGLAETLISLLLDSLCEAVCLIFISLGKMKKKPTTEMTGQATKTLEELRNARGIKVLGWYWTLGRYDTVIIFEAENEKEALKSAFEVADFVWSETLVAIPREEAIKLL